VSEPTTNEAAAPATDSGLPKFADTKLLHEWKYSSPLIACRFDSTGRYVFTAAQDHAIQRWDLSSGESIVLEGHESWLRGLACSPDGQTLYSAGYDGQLLFWNLAAMTPAVTRRIDAHQGWVRAIDVSPHGEWLATVGNDHLVKVWRTEDGTLAHEFKGHEAHVYSTLFLPDGSGLLSGDLLGQVHQWDLSSGTRLRSFDAGDLHTYNGGQGAHYGGVRSMSLSPDGRHLACGGLHNASNPFGAVQEPLVVLFAWDSAEKIQPLLADNITQGIVWRAVYHPSGTLIGASGGGTGGFLLFWPDGVEKAVHQFKLPNTVLDMDLHADAQHVATVHYDRQVRISQLA
jgi:WD40 repeat protein